MWLAAHETPELVICSTATRATETLEALRETLAATRIVLDEDVYLASGTELLAMVRMVDDTVHSLLVVGHNPGLQELALLIAEPSDLRDDAAAKLPTGAVACFVLHPRRWAEVGPGTGTLVDLVRPRDLPEEPVSAG